MSLIPLPVLSLLAYCLPTLIGVLAVKACFKVAFDNYLTTVLALPIALWESGAYLIANKSLSNMVIEPAVLGAAILLLTVVFGAWTKFGGVSNQALRTAFGVASLLCALAVVALMPDFGE